MSNTASQTLSYISGKRKYLLMTDSNGLKEISSLVEIIQNNQLAFDFLNFDQLNSEPLIKKYLSNQIIGTYLYLVGTKNQVRPIIQLAQLAGFSEEEMQVKFIGKEVKRIFCSKCYTIHPTSNQKETVCPKCGVVLTVSDHYSNRYDAYLGYIKIK